MSDSQRILITGGAGFIGASTAKRLIGKATVILFDNLQRNALASVLGEQEKGVEFVKGDVTDADGVARIIEAARPTHVVHAAGVAGIDSVGKFPVRTIEVNMMGTANVLRACLALKDLKRVVCFSTSEIFGSHAMRPDNTAPAVIGAVGEPRWVYAVSKLGAEHLAFAYHRQHGLPTTTLRPFNVYGPGQVGEGALREFIRRALKNAPIDLYGDGAQIRSWCYVDDMVDGVLLALEKDGAVGEAFNIGNPRATETMANLADRVKRLLNSTSEVRLIAREGADIALRIPNIDHAQSLLGFAPKVDLDQGIVRTAEAYAREL